ncbi:hypothetical protein BJV82DRAFT_587469 [Fennellomyces sp. T-0311]|nr:hypothetical protein BJV82DRAFT_587469 [Fennellomyces sp. T-0311]
MYVHGYYVCSLSKTFFLVPHTYSGQSLDLCCARLGNTVISNNSKWAWMWKKLPEPQR